MLKSDQSEPMLYVRSPPPTSKLLPEAPFEKLYGRLLPPMLIEVPVTPLLN